MRVNWPMLMRLGHRLTVKNPCHLRDLACETTTLSPEETTHVAPALYPKNAMDKVTGLSPWRHWSVETPLIEGGKATHAATKAHTVENVHISGPFVYKGASKYDAGYGDERLLQRKVGATQSIDRAVLVSCFGGSRFFGPFLKDSLTQELLPDDSASMIAMRTKTYDHEPGYRALFELPAPRTIERGHIRKLTFFDDFGQNAGKEVRYNTLKSRLRKNVIHDNHRPPVGVYLKRGMTGEARILTNEQAFEDHLQNLGFDIVEPAELPADEIARRTLDAPIAISVEGSHMSHVVYSMAPSGTLLVLQPPHRFAMAFKECTDRIGLRFAFFVGDPADGGFSVDLDEFQRFLDDVIA